MEKEVFFLRHGQTDHNLRRIVQGRGVDTRLNEAGLEQAKLFHEYYEHHNFDRLYCSSQIRAFQTIQFFESSELKILRDDRIDEINWGEHEGKSGGADLMDKYYRIIESWSNGHYLDKAIGGESAEELAVRISQFLRDLENDRFNKALVCTHGRTLRALMCILKKQPLSHMEKIEHHNTGLYHTKFNGFQWQVLKENDLRHLESNKVM